jgi:hypothetical protein
MLKVPNLLLKREAGILVEMSVPFYHSYAMNPGVSNADVFGKSWPTVK